jgi:hypothetical protein
MKIVLGIDVARKNITFENESLFNVTEQDFSWIPSNVTYILWYGNKGSINYEIDKDGNGFVEFITELGIYEKGIEMFHNEKKRIADEQRALEEALEAARNYWTELRFLRNNRLFECDWTQIKDVPLTEEQKTAWETYRQELRDLPENITDPKPLVRDMNNSQWPVTPFPINP